MRPGTLPIPVVVVTYNSAGTIDACLRSVMASTVPTQLVVVDNASTDETVSTVRGSSSDAIVSEMAENGGFAAGCNEGYRRARALGSRYVFFLNPDAEVESACIETLVDAMESDPHFAVASPLIVAGRTGTIWYAGALLDPEHLQYVHLHVGEQWTPGAPDAVATGRPTGCAMLVRTSAVDIVGDMDESYFLYWEEAEWMLRFRDAGFGVAYVARAHARHHVSSATGGDGHPTYEYYFLRNRLRLTREHSQHGRVNLLLRSLPNSGRRIVEVSRSQSGKAGLGVARAIAFAYADFWRGRSGRRNDIAGLPGGGGAVPVG